MNCPLKSRETVDVDAVDVLLDYAAGRLDRERSARFEEHMAVCADCAAFQSGQDEVWKALDVWEPEPVGMDFNRRMWQKLDAAAAAPWYRKLVDSVRLGAWKPALPLTAAVLLVAAGFVMDHQGSAPVTPVTVNGGGVSITEADQVEKTLDDIQLLRELDATNGNEPNSSRPM